MTAELEEVRTEGDVDSKWKKKRRRLLIICLALIFSPQANSVDLDSYCAGWCRSRYQDGMAMRGKCACYDLYVIHMDSKLVLPKRMKAPRSITWD